MNFLGKGGFFYLGMLARNHNIWKWGNTHIIAAIDACMLGVIIFLCFNTYSSWIDIVFGAGFSILCMMR